MEQAIHQCKPAQDKLVHHSDPPNIGRSNTRNGWQKPKLRRLQAMSGTPIPLSDASIACRAVDNAMAETINGFFKAEVIHRRGPWRNFEVVEYANLEWVDWFNNRCLLEPIGNIPPAEAEARFMKLVCSVTYNVVADDYLSQKFITGLTPHRGVIYNTAVAKVMGMTVNVVSNLKLGKSDKAPKGVVVFDFTLTTPIDQEVGSVTITIGGEQVKITSKLK